MSKLHAMHNRLEFHCLCRAAEAVFHDWWQLKAKEDAIALIRRCATAYLIRQKQTVALTLMFSNYQHTYHIENAFLTVPDEVDWYVVRALPRFFRMCTEKLRVAYDADIRFRKKRQLYVARYKLRIDRLEMLSMWAYHIHRALQATKPEPAVVAVIRSRINVV